MWGGLHFYHNRSLGHYNVRRTSFLPQQVPGTLQCEVDFISTTTGPWDITMWGGLHFNHNRSLGHYNVRWTSYKWTIQVFLHFIEWGTRGCVTSTALEARGHHTVWPWDRRWRTWGCWGKHLTRSHPELYRWCATVTVKYIHGQVKSCKYFIEWGI